MYQGVLGFTLIPFDMERRMRKKAHRQMTFNKKMTYFITKALIISTVLIVTVSAVSTMISLINKSAQMAMKEVDTMAANTEDSFTQYYDLIWSINLNEHIQRYLKENDKEQQTIKNAYSVLDNICNMNKNLNFISVVREDERDFLIKGNAIPNWLPDYKGKIKEDYNNSISMRNNVVRMVYSNTYGRGGEYGLSIYYPLYSNSVIGQRLGTLCINVKDSNLNQLMNRENPDGNFAVNTYFVHEEGEIIVPAGEKEMGMGFEEMKFRDAKEGELISDTGLAIYEKLTGWDFYYVTHIGWWDLAKDSLGTVVILLLLLCGLLVFFTKNAKQIVEQQEQMNQIRLDALHSQIQPHFLYNTLDCIHWQAVVSGDSEISNMVKALATYYRICLSKGKDIITLHQELDYVKSYLYIQRMRYGEVLNYEIIAEEGLGNTAIPKLTLQPLVENAIYHGIKSAGGQEGHIVIRVSEISSDIAIFVEDDGAGMSQDKVEEMNRLVKIFDEQFGYGVRNVNRRIQLFCGENYGLTYMKNQKGGITVRVLIPKIQQSGGEGSHDAGIDSR